MDTERLELLADRGGWATEQPIEITGADPVLASPWPIGEVAAAALGQVGAAAARLARLAGGDPGTVHVEVGDAAAATIGFALLRVDGEPMQRTNAENPWVGRYRCADGRWIHLHGGFPTLVERLAAVLGLEPGSGEDAIAAAVETRQSERLEDEVAAVDGCAAIIRTEDEWRDHRHGRLVHTWPAAVVRRAGVGIGSRWSPSPARPLDGLRVLDLTRVLAGPTCGRTLAAFGADVLHVRGPNVPFVPAFVIDTGHGKRQAHCDLTDPDQLAVLRAVALDADVVVQGYRPGVVARHGLDEGSLRADGFTGLFGSVSAYGHDGPWADRAGWEQLAQSTSGLCLDPLGNDKPAMLPSAATDYTTGFVLAAGLMDALGDALSDGTSRRVDASLCQTAAWILRVGRLDDGQEPSGIRPRMQHSASAFGAIDHLGPGVVVDGLDVGWTRPTTPLGQGSLRWES